MSHAHVAVRRGRRPLFSNVLATLSVLPEWWAVGAVLGLALIFGGGTRQGFWSDALVQLASLPLLGAALFKLAQVRMGPGPRGRGPCFGSHNLTAAPAAYSASTLDLVGAAGALGFCRHLSRGGNAGPMAWGQPQPVRDLAGCIGSAAAHSDLPLGAVLGSQVAAGVDARSDRVRLRERRAGTSAARAGAGECPPILCRHKRHRSGRLLCQPQSLCGAPLFAGAVHGCLGGRACRRSTAADAGGNRALRPGIRIAAAGDRHGALTRWRGVSNGGGGRELGACLGRAGRRRDPARQPLPYPWWRSRRSPCPSVRAGGDLAALRQGCRRRSPLGADAGHS